MSLEYIASFEELLSNPGLFDIIIDGSIVDTIEIKKINDNVRIIHYTKFSGEKCGFSLHIDRCAIGSYRVCTTYGVGVNHEITFTRKDNE